MSRTILMHATACVPAESYDRMVNTPTGERYFPCQNLSTEPTMYFRMDPADYLQTQAAGDMVVLVHSRPDDLPFLSDIDRRLQVQGGLPWRLVCGNRICKFRCMPFLTGRAFEYSVTDCYALFHDAYHLAGIEMPDFARKEDQWRQGDNLYLDNLEMTGFYRVDVTGAQPGGILVCYFGSSVASHTAIYCSDGGLLHHIPDRFSRRERYVDKWQRRTYPMWRHRAWHESVFTGTYNDLDAASAPV